MHSFTPNLCTTIAVLGKQYLCFHKFSDDHSGSNSIVEVSATCVCVIALHDKHNNQQNIPTHPHPLSVIWLTLLNFNSIDITDHKIPDFFFLCPKFHSLKIFSS